MLFASGVFYYFLTRQVRDLVQGMADAFPGGVLVFDAANRTAVKMIAKTWLRTAKIKDSCKGWRQRNENADREDRIWRQTMKYAGMDKEKKPYIFVGLVCVREQYQGQGYMRKVLDLAFAEGDRLGVPVILETDAKSKCDKYVHLGMKLAGTHDLGTYGKLYDLIKYPEPTKANGIV